MERIIFAIALFAGATQFWSRKKPKKRKRKKKKKSKKIRTFSKWMEVSNLHLLGKVLVLGEVDFSFSLSLVSQNLVRASTFVATSYLTVEELPLKRAARINAEKMTKRDTRVMFGVDGTKLYNSLQEKFDVIFFPFPRASLYHGAYENDVDLKANQELMKKFFSCMRSHLEPNGKIILIFNHLENQPKIPQFTSWKVESLAKKASFALTDVQPFDPADLSLYVTRQVTGKHWKPSFASVYVFERAEKPRKSKRTKRKREAEFDLWPREKKVRSNPEKQEGRWFRDSFINPNAESIVLLPGLVLIRNWLTLEGQQKIVDTCRGLSKQPGGFYTPTYESGAKVKLRQMCLGWHWDIVAEKYEKSRTNFDGAPVVEMTEEFRDLCRRCLADAAKTDPSVMGKRTNVDMDICVLNFYTHRGRNGLHVDKDESPETMSAGSPIVSFSIGLDADFAYTEHTIEEVRNSNVEVPVVKLQSGDALCFGGPSRMLTHALTRVYPDTAPELLHMTTGRLNLTFREL